MGAVVHSCHCRHWYGLCRGRPDRTGPGIGPANLMANLRSRDGQHGCTTDGNNHLLRNPRDFGTTGFCQPLASSPWILWASIRSGRSGTSTCGGRTELLPADICGPGGTSSHDVWPGCPPTAGRLPSPGPRLCPDVFLRNHGRPPRRGIWIQQPRLRCLRRPISCRSGRVALYFTTIGRHISTSSGRLSGATGGSLGPPVSSTIASCNHEKKSHGRPWMVGRPWIMETLI